MYRSTYSTQNGFLASSNLQTYGRYTSTSGMGQRAPLYPIGPTLTQPQFKPMQRGVSPSPYLSRQGIKPPSYENRYLQKAQNLASQINLTYQQRQKRLIEKNQRELEQQQKRRQQIRISYERQINNLTAKLNRNLQKKHKLHAQIQLLQKTHEGLNQKLLQMKPPQRNNDNLQHIDRKQQQMIILKNRLMSSMRQNQIELTKKLEQQEKHWEIQVTQKQKILFQMEQQLRDKRMQLHRQKQQSLEKPDLLTIQQEVRSEQYRIFEQKYQDLERHLKNLMQNRQKINKQVKDNMQLRKPQYHNDNLKKEDAARERVNLQLRVKQLQRVSQEMEAANQNLSKDLERKQSMITKYEQDIHSLKSKKQQVQTEINYLMQTARSRDATTLSKSLNDIVTKTNQEIRIEQTKGGRLKNAYQKLYELLCSATSKNIHQAFSQSLTN